MSSLNFIKLSFPLIHYFIHGFSYLFSRFEEESQSFFDQTRPLRSPASVPPEERSPPPHSQAGAAPSPSPPTARDAFGFGRLAEEALAKCKGGPSEDKAFLVIGNVGIALESIRVL